MVKDTREQGMSYGYVVVPKGGKTVDGVRFPEGPRAAGKKGWFKLLLIAGCDEINEAEYLDLLKESQSLPGKETASGDAQPVHARGDQVKAPRKVNRPRPRRDARLVPAGG